MHIILFLLRDDNHGPLRTRTLTERINPLIYVAV